MKHYARLQITNRMLRDLLGLPEDCIIRSISYQNWNDNYYALLESEEFSMELDEGSLIPEIDIVVTSNGRSDESLDITWRYR